MFCRTITPLTRTHRVCFSFPSLTPRQILMGIQELLDEPNPESPAQSEAYNLYVRNRDEYKKRVRVEARKYTPAT